MPMLSLSALQIIVRRHLGEHVLVQRVDAATGGCVSVAQVLVLQGGQRHFLKTHQAGSLALFQAEALGLQTLAATQTLRVPAVLGHGMQGTTAYLLLEYLPLQGTPVPQRAGAQLAALHRHQAPRYGWVQDNTLGGTPQPNPAQTQWVHFWQQHRLGFQLERARQHGYPVAAYEQGLRLQAGLGAFFTDYRPAASLLHGDLWRGNLAYLPDGSPVVYDPAVYYGDREADLAMTELFGGFEPAFYAAYRAAWALDAGYAVRKHLYNLYHVLNHFNLFGGAYAAQAVRMTGQLLAELE